MTHTLLNAPAIYKPMKYEWAFHAWKAQQSVHWLPEEVPLGDDVKDWWDKLTDAERNLVVQIFRFFTQSDVEVSGTYAKYFSVFKPIEILMMLSAFMNIETIHIAAYAHLLDTIGMPETEYSAFLKYSEMKEKHDYLQGFQCDSKTNIALTLAAFGGFAEGMALFASFAMLLNFPRHNKMKGMGQIVSWSVRDECYAEGTEVLTESGWVDFKDLGDRRVCQYDMETKEVSFVVPDRIVEYDVDTDLVWLRNEKFIDTLVTQAHGIVVTDKDTGKTSRQTAVSFSPHTRKAFPVSGFISNGNTQRISALERFKIAFCADGSMPDHRHTGSRCGHIQGVISLKKERKIVRLRDILSEAGLTYSERELKDGRVKFIVNMPTFMDKKLSNICDISKVGIEWIDDFFNELIHWDGHDRYEDGKVNVFGTTNKSDVDFIQGLASISGRSANACLSVDPRGHKDYWRVTIKSQTEFRTGQVKKTLKPYKGKVRCVTVPTGAIVTRFNNKVVISGNTLHCASMAILFKTFIQENPEIDTPELRAQIVKIAREMVSHEDAFIDLAFEMGPVQGLDAEQVKQYIRYIADRRLVQLGLVPIYNVEENPLPWIDEMMAGVEHSNFFEARSTEYSKAATEGEWDDIFG